MWIRLEVVVYLYVLKVFYVGYIMWINEFWLLCGVDDWGVFYIIGYIYFFKRRVLNIFKF